MIGFFGATKDWSKATCTEVLARHDKLQLLSTPEGGRSKSHQKEAAAALSKLEPFYQRCVASGGVDLPADIAQEEAAVGQKLTDDYPLAMSSSVNAGSDFGVSPMTIGLLVVAGLAGVWFLTRKK